jgi:membrane-associated protein
MSAAISFLLSLLLLYKYWALLLVFFFSALILPLPTSTVLLATGAFASQGYFSFFLSLFVVVASNVLGDYTGYFLAHRYGRRVFQLLHIRVPVFIGRLEIFLKKYPGPAVFLTRFAGTTDVLVNLLSGFGGVSLTAFLFYDIIGNLVSDGGLLYAGYFLGVHWQDFTGLFDITDYILIGVVVIVAIYVVVRYRNRAHHSEYAGRI